MSRVDEALRRARGEEPSAGASTTGALNAPWQFAADETVAPAAPPAPAPAARSAAVQASAPAASSEETLPSRRDDQPPSLGRDEKIVGAALEPAVVEEYRKLAASLHQAQLDRGLQVLLVASAVPSEGKSLTAANLALTLSMSYSRNTLLIDADLRRPALHTVFRHPVTSGLSEALDPSASHYRVSAIQLTPRLALLPAGRPVENPVPLLTSGRMSELLRDARQHFDWILIDTPPVAGLTDANLLASLADASLLVVRAGSTPHAAVEQAVHALGKPRIFGVVLNRVEDTPKLVGGYDKYGAYYSSKHTHAQDR